MKFTGRELDSESGLYYYRARYYDPYLGRFISEDPIGFDGGINFYAYVDNNPLNATDPSGNVIKWLDGPIKESIEYLRKLGVERAWKEERNMVERMGYGTREWTQEEMNILLDVGKVPGYEGHHINSVASNPMLAHCPDNVCFKTRAEHLDAHDGDWTNQTSGPLLDRSGGGFDLYGAAIDVGILTLTGASNMLDTIALFDPTTYMFSVPSLGGCNNGICSDMLYPESNFNSGANGGFVLYPNKPNTNMVNSVYKK
jgi:RHS repeat-associated protein